MLVRDASVGGAAAAMTVMEAVFDPAWGEAWSERQLGDFLLGMGSILLLAAPADEPQEAVVGFALIRMIAGEAELMLLGVLPEMRRRGVGQALLDAAFATTASRGAETIFLEVRASNDGARLLYQRAGFRMIGRRPGYYRGAGGMSHDAVTYSKPLS